MKPAASKSKDDSRDNDASDEEEMAGKHPLSAARRRERARCAAIFASPHAAEQTALAATLAFGTSLSRSEAIEMLAVAQGATTGRTAGGLGQRDFSHLHGKGQVPAAASRNVVRAYSDEALLRAGAGARPPTTAPTNPAARSLDRALGTGRGSGGRR